MFYKVSNNMKMIFIANIVLFLVGVCTQENIYIAASIIISVLLELANEILEAIYYIDDEN
jgi:hypothetical protein